MVEVLRRIARPLALDAAVSLMAGALTVLPVAIVVDGLHGDASLVGPLAMASGIGALVGGIGSAAFAARGARTGMAVGIVTASAAVLAMGGGSLPIALGAMAACPGRSCCSTAGPHLGPADHGVRWNGRGVRARRHARRDLDADRLRRDGRPRALAGPGPGARRGLRRHPRCRSRRPRAVAGAEPPGPGGDRCWSSVKRATSRLFRRDRGRERGAQPRAATRGPACP